MELLAACLMVKTLNFLIPVFELNITHIYLLSDSTVTLNWINATSYKFHTFVANRVAEIQSFKFPHTWSHIISSKNPTDYGIRGLSVKEFLNLQYWLSGLIEHFNNPPQPFVFDGAYEI